MLFYGRTDSSTDESTDTLSTLLSHLQGSSKHRHGSGQRKLSQIHVTRKELKESKLRVKENALKS